MSKHFHINYKLNYIAISMKQENGSSKRSIKIMDYEDVDCLISLFQQLREHIFVYVISNLKSRNKSLETTNIDV